MQKANKSQPHFIGPFIVNNTAHLDSNIVMIDALDRPGRHQTISTLHLKLFIPHPAKEAFITEAVFLYLCMPSDLYLYIMGYLGLCGIAFAHGQPGGSQNH
uniref:Uncharacterized protein n=1 Tax=Romanomermis culicivorax TaxID=13658 RepID=A0A915I9I6_ROMCU